MSINFKGSNIELNYNNRLMIDNIENCPNKVVEELSEASDVISNYAKSKKSQIWVKPEEGMDYLYLQTLTKKSKSTPLPTKDGNFLNRVDSSKLGSKTHSISMIDASEKGDKPFLRRFYEKIQYMIEGTEPRIETMKKETLLKLKQIGKIK